MSEVQQDPGLYFEGRDLVEGLVLHAELRGTEFLFVFEYLGDEYWIARKDGAKTRARDLRMLRFGEVAGFEFEPRSTLLAGWKNIDKSTPGSVTITGIELQRTSGPRAILLVLGSHGIVRFSFETLHESGRRLRDEGRLPDGAWRYVDADTDEVVPFDHPFGDPPETRGRVTTNWQRWVEAARVLGRTPTELVRCPACENANLTVEDVFPHPNAEVFERYMECPACGASNALRKSTALDDGAAEDSPP